ncbi:MAG: thiamine phosphate synthase [Gemmataceae bacterium]|nr:thiamine phosphate synthase [Gemmataceae bacterium]
MEYLLSPGAERAMTAAQSWAARLGSEIVQLTHFILALLDEEEGRVAQLLHRLGLSPDRLREQLLALPPAPPVPSPETLLALARDWSLSCRQDPQVLTDALLLAVLQMDPQYAAAVAPLGLDLPRLQAAVLPASPAPESAAESTPYPLSQAWPSPLPPPPSETSPRATTTSPTAESAPPPAPQLTLEPIQNAPSYPPPDVSSVSSASVLISPASAAPAVFDAVAPPLPLLRVLDTNCNRAREALRVLEDFCRFVRNDPSSTEEVKTLRHDFARWEQRLPLSLRLSARDTPADVGTTLTAAGEYQRASLEHVCQINLKRLQEALRSLEEYGKLLDPSWAKHAEQFRYRTYHLEGRLLHSSRRQQLLAQARLYWLFTPSAAGERWEWRLEQALSGGVQVVQLREKHLADRACLQLAQALRRRCHQARVLFLVNDRPDLALWSEADGVHLGQDDLPIAQARHLLGREALIGVSTHTIEQVHQAWQQGADYIGIGPVFPSQTKAFDHFPGLEFVRQATAVSVRPAFALGGITPENLLHVLAAGARRIAVSACLSQASDPASIAAQLRALLDSYALPGVNSVDSSGPAPVPAP